MSNIVGLVAPLSVFIMGGFLVGHRYRDIAVVQAKEFQLATDELAAAVRETEKTRKGITDLRNNVYLKQTEALELYHAAPAILQEIPQPRLMKPPLQWVRNVVACAALCNFTNCLMLHLTVLPPMI